MRIALIRREYITHLDGVNRFIALLAEGLAKLGHDPLIMTWCYNGIAKDKLPGWFAKNAWLKHHHTYLHVANWVLPG